jgi:flagellar protein FlaH
MVKTMSMILEKEGQTDGLAEKFGKEIPEGSLVFIEGTEGTGKSIICQRICYSFLKNGYNCSYLSTQFTVKNFVRQMASVSYNIKKYLLKGKIFFISTESILGETLPKEDFFDKLLDCKKLFDPEIIIIDSISTLLKESLNTTNMIDLFNFFNRWAGTGKIIILSANPNEWEPRIHQTFKLTSDVHFELAHVNVPGVGLSNHIYVHKFNGAKFKYQNSTAFSVRPGIGISLESTHVAF